MLSPSSYNHRSVTLPNSRNYHLVDSNPTASKILFCLHGFPDLWYGWRYQIDYFTKRGWRVITPSMLGYHPTDAPIELEAYTLKSMADDLALLLETLGITQKVVVLGHDWGGMMAWRFAAYYPSKVSAVGVLCTPYTPPSQPGQTYRDPTTLIRTLAPNFGYQLFFASPTSTDLLTTNLREFLAPLQNPTLRNTLRARGRGEEWVREGFLEDNLKKLQRRREEGRAVVVPEDAEWDVYLEAYRTAGFRGPLNWYKTRELNHIFEIQSRLSKGFPEIPALFVAPTKDEALPLWMSEGMERYFKKGGLKKVLVDGGDHWIMQDERFRDSVNEIIEEWLSGLEGRMSKL